MRVKFQVNGKAKYKNESPMSIAAINRMWVLGDVVVSDEDEDATEETKEESRLKIDACRGQLPMLVFSKADLDLLPEEIRRAVLWNAKQSNNLLCHLN